MLLIPNPRALRTAYPEDLRALLSLAAAEEGRRWLARWDALAPGPTPLWSLPDQAQALGLGQLWLKDEGQRSALGSFKALGAPLALARLVLRHWPEAGLDAGALFSGAHRAVLGGFTVVSATDGNHGRALAAAARSLGCPCVIVLHAQVSAEREAAIAALGARTVRIAGDYDASVAEAARLAAEHGWQVVSDTSYPGYEAVPRDVMQGYALLAVEADAQRTAAGAAPFTHVVLQGGVGGLAAGVLAPLWERHGAQRPTVLVVEPEQADCLAQSARLGRVARATGTVDSVMAGLACGEPSPLAWRFLERGADWFLTVRDDEAVQAMRRLAAGSARDVPVVGGESGVAGLAGLQALQARGEAARLGLGPDARVLCINTEGATAPAVYQQLVGEPAAAVQARQQAWLAAQAR